MADEYHYYFNNNVSLLRRPGILVNTKQPWTTNKQSKAGEIKTKYC
ncbi:protein of unknown function [Rhodovastum atsumiense]|nr:protein of unknown function [Rhodovastum atsumiense]